MERVFFRKKRHTFQNNLQNNKLEMWICEDLHVLDCNSYGWTLDVVAHFTKCRDDGRSPGESPAAAPYSPDVDRLPLCFPPASFLHFPTCSTEDVASWPRALLDVSEGLTCVCVCMCGLNCSVPLVHLTTSLVMCNVLASVLQKTIHQLCLTSDNMLNLSNLEPISCLCVKSHVWPHVIWRVCESL